jgi:hypothetical protein
MRVNPTRLALARVSWIASRRRAEEAQEAFRIADDAACQHFANYVELTQPGFAKFFRGVFQMQRSIEDEARAK